MARRPAIMFYKGDWKRDPELSMCCPATRGIWIDLICDMDDLERPTITGTLKQIARTCRASESEVLEAMLDLKSSNAAIVEIEGDIYTVTNRKLKKELELSEVRATAVQNRYKTPTNGLQNGYKSSTKPLQNAESENANANESVLVLKPKPDSEKIYRAYPRKIGKAAAIRAINSAFHRLIAGESQEPMDGLAANEFLTRAVESFARSPAGNSERFTPHPATWFNQSRYLDDPNEWHRSNGNGANQANRQFNRVDAQRDELRKAGVTFTDAVPEDSAGEVCSPEGGCHAGGAAGVVLEGIV